MTVVQYLKSRVVLQRRRAHGFCHPNQLCFGTGAESRRTLMKDHEEINAPKSNIHVPRPPSLCSLHPLARAAQLSYEAMRLESHTHRMHICLGSARCYTHIPVRRMRRRKPCHPSLRLSSTSRTTRSRRRSQPPSPPPSRRARSTPWPTCRRSWPRRPSPWRRASTLSTTSSSRARRPRGGSRS